MFEFLFPIFCFGVLIVAVVAKGLFLAADMNAALNSEEKQILNLFSDAAEISSPARTPDPLERAALDQASFLPRAHPVSQP